MLTSMLNTRLIAVSVALGLLFTSFAPFTKRECYLPTPAAQSSSVGESFGSLTVIEADDVEFSFRFIEWLRGIF